MASEIGRATPPEAAPAARAMNAEPEQADDFLRIVPRARAENERCKIDHPAKGPAPPESIFFSVPVGVRA